MKATLITAAVGTFLLAASSTMTGVWTSQAARRLASRTGVEPAAAIAGASDESYCTGALKPILRRVLTSCGLLKSGQLRGCQPLEAKSVAAMSGGDFNALFRPLAHRAAIIQFELDQAELDEAARALLHKTFSDQRGASYFLVVSRASPEGSIAHNRRLSQKRGTAVLDHLRHTFKDPDLDQEVGLLWLGEEFAQLKKEFCTWTRSHPDRPCNTAELNRSAFVAWIDCRL